MNLDELDLRRAASQVRSAEDALAFWCAYEAQLEKSALLVGVPGNMDFRVSLRGTFGRSARLLSLFAQGGIFVLDRTIYREMVAGRRVQIPLEYTISFDTNVASYFRLFFRGESSSNADLMCFLRHFRGQLNFGIFPYLCENAHRFTNGCPPEIAETVVASHWLGDLDADEFTK